MRRIERTAQFRRDYKRERRGRNRATLDTALIEVLKSLTDDRPLAERRRDHSLTGDWHDRANSFSALGLGLMFM